jgi:hypothetical protein
MMEEEVALEVAQDPVKRMSASCMLVYKDRRGEGKNKAE